MLPIQQPPGGALQGPIKQPQQGSSCRVQGLLEGFRPQGSWGVNRPVSTKAELAPTSTPNR